MSSWSPEPAPTEAQLDELAEHPERWAWACDAPEGRMTVGPGLHPTSKAFAVAMDAEMQRVRGPAFGVVEVLGGDPFAATSAAGDDDSPPSA